MNYGMSEWMNGGAAGEIGLEVGHHRAFDTHSSRVGVLFPW